jgi:hypothetical protein
MTERTCDGCGAPLAGSMQVCPVCGMPVPDGAEEGSPLRRRSVLRAFVAVLIIFALTFGTILVILLAATRGGGYPQGAEQEFLSGCARNGTPLETCRCVLTEIEKRFTARQFESVMDRYARTGTVPAGFLEAIRACQPGAPSTGPTPA